ncbi:DNA methyltransferase [Aeromonas dhakensis]|uniref:DNA methyltransferase n=1 Tax=Aeromonas dhakensis TaxID=196024 RepID=UPI0021B4635F|nr:DNA methyltransferase [Aeromonas dhakensis]
MTNSLFYAEHQNTPVECLGQTFPSEKARREHFTKLLAEKLKDPAFRKIEGFPQGTDEAILTMSDPPYYTACPNPFLEDFVRHYGKPYDPSVKYSREPQTVDVSVGKTDALYKAHSYHTKVPHLAIVPSILHYTEPGDIVLDGFGGSGMTGVAAQWCGLAPATYRHELEIEWKKQDKSAPKWGGRRIILNDLSPAATFIAANYNLPFDVEDFSEVSGQLLKEVEQELGWMYETTHTDGKTKGRIEYTVWSEVFNCPECAGEVNFLDQALDTESKRVRDEFACPHCGAELNKKKLDKCYENIFDPVLKKTVQQAKRLPSIIFYSVDGEKREKKPDQADLQLIERINSLEFPLGFPIDRMMNAPEDCESWGDKWRAGTASFTHVHHLFLPRARHALSALWRKAYAIDDRRIRNMVLYFVEQAVWGMSLLARYTPTHFSQVNQYLTGVYYIGSQVVECSPDYVLGGKRQRLGKAFRDFRAISGSSVTTLGSAARIPIPNNSIDYIFTDPPFGNNLAYSELNFVVEAFHGVVTHQAPEAVMSKSQQKGLLEYHRLMRACFSEYFRVLKPGRWMTVVFSNTQAAVWNGIQTALQEAGFVIANVSALNKQQGSFNAVTNATSVKQDLVITAYKPNGGLEDRFQKSGGNVDSVWDFVRTHLSYLASVKMKGDELEFIKERDPRIIFDRMVAWFVRHGFPVPLSSQEFQAGLSQRFEPRDGMIFLPEQAAEYDKKRMQVAVAPQMEMFVSDERSAIDWLTEFLKKRPSTYSEITPEYMPVVGAAKKKGEVIPELARLLDENFIQYDGKGDVPSQIHSYLSTNHKDLRGLEKNSPALIAKAKDRWYVPDPNKAQDLEKKREKVLLKEFETYKAFTGRKIKESRLEVLRAGFRAAWAAKDYQTIIGIANKLSEETLQEDEKLLTLYDLALTRTEDGI